MSSYVATFIVDWIMIKIKVYVIWKTFLSDLEIMKWIWYFSVYRKRMQKRHWSLHFCKSLLALKNSKYTYRLKKEKSYLQPLYFSKQSCPDLLKVLFTVVTFYCYFNTFKKQKLPYSSEKIIRMLIQSSIVLRKEMKCKRLMNIVSK